MPPTFTPALQLPYDSPQNSNLPGVSAVLNAEESYESFSTGIGQRYKIHHLKFKKGEMSSTEGNISQDDDSFSSQPKSISHLVSNLKPSNKIRRKKRTNLSPSAGEKENICSWISENIKKKECMYYMESSKNTNTRKSVCMCGYPKEKHLDIATRPQPFQSKETWDLREHIKEMPTDAFGDVSFTGLGPRVGKYVRVSSDTPSGVLYQLMTEQWGLEVPNLLISVTGGAKDFRMKMRLKNIFRRGLVKAAQTTGAWIITGGSHAGVMKQVGEAVRDFCMGNANKNSKIVTIGIATWGIVHNRNSLITSTGAFPAEYQIDEENQGSLSCLDNNHSHFILVDDGTNGRYGVEIILRARLEKFISEQTKEKGGKQEFAIRIPIVCVVLEGGPGTLDTIYNAISNNTPCVIVEGSGRVADVIAQVAQLPISKITTSVVQEKLRTLFPDAYDTFTEHKIVEWTKKIQDIMRHSQLLTIFQSDKDDQHDIDVAILQALLKASLSHDQQGHENWDHQLKLAVAWNRVDIARSEIFTDDHQWKPSDLHPVMTAALIGNKPEFVKLFLEHGVRLEEYATQETILNLYNNTESSCLFYSKLAKIKEDERFRCEFQKASKLHLHHVSQVLRELLGDFTKHLYPKPKSTDRLRLSIAVPHIKINVQKVTLRSFHKRSQGKASCSMDPTRDLLIWAIVQNRKELADIFWAQCHDCTVAAIGCSKILKELSKEEDDTDTSEDMLALAEDYEQKAIGVFTESYRKDEERALKLLIRVSEAWGQTTCLKLALEAKDMKFVSHGGVQAFLTRVWFGELSVDNALWRVIVCMLFFPLIYTRLLTFRKDEEIIQNQVMKKENNTHDMFPVECTPGECMPPTALQNMTGRKITNCRSMTERFQAFFMAPVVIFHLNILSYFGFLLLFAYVLMTDFQPVPSWREHIIYFWLFSLVCEETRQLIYDPDRFGLLKQASLYYNDFWNKLDVCAILIFIGGLICRLIPATFYPGRIILSLDFVIFCLRLMHIFTISKTLGPKIIIVKRMMKDVFFFLFLLAVWVISFGVAKQAILIHNEMRVDWIFRGVVYHSYMTLFGQIPSYIDGVNFNLDQCTINGTDPNKQKCPESNKENHLPIFPQWLTVLLLCLYLLFTNILLLNLLIAMFNYTFQQVQEHTDQIWKFQRHDLIEEYNGRPPAPPPFILFNHLHQLIQNVILHKPAGRQKQLKEKLEKNEEAALLSWETYLKENYLQHLQKQMKQSTEQKIRDTSEKVNTVVDMLELDQVKKNGSIENRLIFLEEQALRSAKALNWIVNTLLDNGFGSKESAPVVVSSKLLGDIDLKDMNETLFSTCHVNSRNILYPDSNVVRFPVPDEKVPWEVEFSIYNPPFYTAIRKNKPFHDPYTDSPETLMKINYNTLDGTVNRQSYCATYVVQDGLPLNPIGRTGLKGRGSLCWFGPNHAIHPIITQWKRNKDGSVCRKKSKKVLEVLAIKHVSSEHWALLGGTMEPGETLPHKLKRILKYRFLDKFEELLNNGSEVYKGYVDDPRNTDNAWIETTAISLHFDRRDDHVLLELNQNIQSKEQEISVRWQVVDQKIPLYANHKDILQKVVDCYNAYY
ncbi:PREDICTED: transient receptor potential cation channel subfamily M member 2 [Nanorana parkeri]|uniref:transient receptor potential cation channel subfamily M member 2 n=1 Tax=Nanorana parkeri TaxID=125878 RepID=UPI000853F3E3|nr:PREDICTED: transient receptor potential cation channel subfamily M member 2 [Nanorana parkeri]